jgi:hypothetical protein
MKANEEFLPWAQYNTLLEQLRDAQKANDVFLMRQIISQIVPGYQSVGDVVDWVTLREQTVLTCSLPAVPK